MTPAAPSSPRIDSTPEPQWSDWVHRFADSNFYQTWAYGAVTWGDRQLSHFTLEQNQEPSAIAQLRIVRLPVLNAGVAYLRWGPAIQPVGSPWNPQQFRTAIQGLVHEYSRKRGLLLRILPNIFHEDPHASEARRILEESGFVHDPDTPAYRTIRVDITPDPARIRKNLDQKWRNQLNGAERNGLTITEGTGDELYAQFLRLYDEMMDRKRFETSVDPAEFRRIQERLPAPSKMIIAVCSKDSVPLCSVVCTSVGNAGIYLLGATSNEGMKSKGSYLLHWTIINRLRERGCHWYDLGGVNPDTNPGVYHFKKGFGGQECRMLGRFEHRGGFVSNIAVHTAESLQSTLARLKARLRNRSTDPAPPPANPPESTPATPTPNPAASPQPAPPPQAAPTSPTPTA